jgi:hypothetical protein
MDANNPLLDKVINSCFEIVMQNMTVEQFTKKASKYLQLDKSFHNVKKARLYQKAYNTLSIMVSAQELEKIEKLESKAYPKALLSILEER